MMRIVANENNRDEFWKLVAWIEICGTIGHTCQCFKVGVDGNGAGRLKFELEDKDEIRYKERYQSIKKELFNQYLETSKDLKEISFE